MQTIFFIEIEFWVENLVARCYEDHMSRKILDRISMTLWSLETYGYIDSKTKSYRILRRFFLLFIFYVFWPYKASLPCFLNQQAHLLIIFLRPSLLGFLKFPDLFFNKPLGAFRPLPKSRSCPNNSLNHHRVPRHLSCGFGLLS